MQRQAIFTLYSVRPYLLLNIASNPTKINDVSNDIDDNSPSPSP